MLPFGKEGVERQVGILPATVRGEFEDELGDLGGQVGLEGVVADLEVVQELLGQGLDVALMGIGSAGLGSVGAGDRSMPRQRRGGPRRFCLFSLSSHLIVIIVVAIIVIVNVIIGVNIIIIISIVVIIVITISSSF